MRQLKKLEERGKRCRIPECREKCYHTENATCTFGVVVGFKIKVGDANKLKKREERGRRGHAENATK